MKRFLSKILIINAIVALIFILIFALYVYRDPYYDFYNQKNYKNMSWKYDFLSLGDISTKKLLQIVKSKNEVPSAFIFGSSRSTGFSAEYLSQKTGEYFFHFASWNETIGGVYSKIKLIDSIGIIPKIVLFVIDADYTFSKNGLVQNSDYWAFTNKSEIEEMGTHFLKYIPPQMNKDKLKIMLGLPNKCETNIISSTKYNDLSLQTYVNYYKKVLVKSCNFQAKIANNKNVSQISNIELKYLKDIGKILEKSKTIVWIIYTPIRKGLTLSSNDKVAIKNFLNSRLHIDFSGVNNITENSKYYPDNKHFSIEISRFILDSLINNAF